MARSLTLNGLNWRRALIFLAGLGMVVASIMTIQHYFAANFPETIFEGSFCDISAFFNCDSSAYSAIAAIADVPLGYFGVMVGGLVMLGAVIPSAALERTNKTIALLNGIGVVTLLCYTVFVLGSLCLLCIGYYVFSLLSLGLFWCCGIDGEEPGFVRRFGRPSVMHLVAFGIVTLAGIHVLRLYHQAKEDAQSGGVALRILDEFYSLPLVPWPSYISPYMTAQATERFEDAPIQIVEYMDLLCSDCLYLNRQLEQLKEEFAGKISIAIQLFPLEAKCNDIVTKDVHPGACDVAYMAAYDPEKFKEIHDEIFANFRDARTPEWRAELARRHGVEEALTDSATIAMVDRLIRTGAEYERTSERFEHGIRSTPTMIINNRMVIGTFPQEQLRAIFQALVDEHERGENRFLENWVGG
jgi:predicted DsbA family dithiol-disulfide isomerase/uncharacterized membrane protein